MDKTQPHPLFKLATELGPLLVFFVANAKFHLFVATGAFMVAVIAAMMLMLTMETAERSVTMTMPRADPTMTIMTAAVAVLAGLAWGAWIVANATGGHPLKTFRTTAAVPMKAPVLETDDGPLPESGAILVYLAEGTALLPDDPAVRAQVMRWLFYEQAEVQPGIAGLRFRLLTGRLDPDDPSIAARQATGAAALTVLDDHLREHSFLAGERYSIAEVLEDRPQRFRVLVNRLRRLFSFVSGGARRIVGVRHHRPIRGISRVAELDTQP